MPVALHLFDRRAVSPHTARRLLVPNDLRSESGYVLHERASDFFASGTGWLSLKSFAGGQALYTAGGGTFAVDPGELPRAGSQIRYRRSRSNRTISSSRGAFFGRRPRWQARITPSARRTPACLCDPAPRSPAPTFVERTYPAGDELAFWPDGYVGYPTRCYRNRRGSKRNWTLCWQPCFEAMHRWNVKSRRCLGACSDEDRVVPAVASGARLRCSIARPSGTPGRARGRSRHVVQSFAARISAFVRLYTASST